MAKFATEIYINSVRHPDWFLIAIVCCNKSCAWSCKILLSDVQLCTDEYVLREASKQSQGCFVFTRTLVVAKVAMLQTFPHDALVSPCAYGAMLALLLPEQLSMSIVDVITSIVSKKMVGP